MKKLIYTILFFANLSIVSQNNNDGITIGAYVPEQAEAIPAAAKILSRVFSGSDVDYEREVSETLTSKV